MTAEKLKTPKKRKRKRYKLRLSKFARSQPLGTIRPSHEAECEIWKKCYYSEQDAHDAMTRYRMIPDALPRQLMIVDDTRHNERFWVIAKAHHERDYVICRFHLQCKTTTANGRLRRFDVLAKLDLQIGELAVKVREQQEIYDRLVASCDFTTAPQQFRNFLTLLEIEIGFKKLLLTEKSQSRDTIISMRGSVNTYYQHRMMQDRIRAKVAAYRKAALNAHPELNSNSIPDATPEDLLEISDGEWVVAGAGCANDVGPGEGSSDDSAPILEAGVGDVPANNPAHSEPASG